MSYVPDMRIWTSMLALGCGLIGFAGSAAVAEDAAASPPGNPYVVITNRNAFGVKPPPVPVEPPPVAPVVAPPNLFLTGISFLHGLKRAYLVVNRPNAKAPDYLAVDEGYDSDGLKVLGIDPRKQTVRLVNSGTELTLNFKDNGMKGNAVPAAVPGKNGVPEVPGMAPVRGIPPPPQAGVPAASPGAGPTIIGRGGVVSDNPAPVAANGGGEIPLSRQLPARRGVYLGGQGNNTVPAEHITGGAAAPTANTVPAVPGPVANPGGSRLPPPPIPGVR